MSQLVSVLRFRVFWKFHAGFLLVSAVALGGYGMLSDHFELKEQQGELERRAERLLRFLGQSDVDSDKAELLLSGSQKVFYRDPERRLSAVAPASLSSFPDIELLASGSTEIPIQHQWEDLKLTSAFTTEESELWVLSWDASTEIRAGNRLTTTVVWIIVGLSTMLVSLPAIGPLRLLATAVNTDAESESLQRVRKFLGERNDEYGMIARGLDEILVSHDHRVEEVRRQDADIRATVNQLTAILEAMAEGVIAVDGDEQILFANEVACSMLELDQNSVRGRLIIEAVRNTDFHDVVAEAVRDREHSTVELRLARNDVQLAVSASPIAGSGAVLVLNDVTEMRRLEAMRKDFVAGVSHELKTPLTVIQACTDTLLDSDVQDPRQARNFLTQIQEQCDRLLKMIIRMLQLARVESGEQIFSKDPVDLVESCQAVMSTMSLVAEMDSRELTLDGESELYVLADPQAIQTVIGNLIDNSLKYTDKGGRIELLTKAEDDAASITVRDNGRGIPLREQGRVFERFYRLERDRNRERGGSGLGLAIVKHLCSAMGAEITLESESGKGCAITIRFPFQDEL